MSAIVRPHITYEQLCRMTHEGERWELFDGEAYMSPSPTIRHQEAVARVFEAIRNAIRDRSRAFIAPLDVVLSEDNVVQPDVVFVSEAKLGILADVVRGVPDLVVEVLSGSKNDRDRTMKMELYSRFGVAEYWIVDPSASTIDVHRLDAAAKGWRLEGRLTGDARLRTPLVPALDVPAASLFDLSEAGSDEAR